MDLLYPMLATHNNALSNTQKRPIALVYEFNFEGRTNHTGRKALCAILASQA